MRRISRLNASETVCVRFIINNAKPGVRYTIHVPAVRSLFGQRFVNHYYNNAIPTVYATVELRGKKIIIMTATRMLPCFRRKSRKFGRLTVRLFWYSNPLIPPHKKTIVVCARWQYHSVRCVFKNVIRKTITSNPRDIAWSANSTKTGLMNTNYSHGQILRFWLVGEGSCYTCSPWKNANSANSTEAGLMDSNDPNDG